MREDEQAYGRQRAFARPVQRSVEKLAADALSAMPFANHHCNEVAVFFVRFRAGVPYDAIVTNRDKSGAPDPVELSAPVSDILIFIEAGLRPNPSAFLRDGFVQRNQILKIGFFQGANDEIGCA